MNGHINLQHTSRKPNHTPLHLCTRNHLIDRLLICLLFLFFFSRIFVFFIILHAVFFSQFRSLSFFYARFCRVRFFFAFAVAKQVNVNIASVIMHNNNKSMDLRYHIWFVLKIGRFFFSSHVEKLYLYACTCLRANLTVTFLYLALEISMSFTLELIKKLFSSFVFSSTVFLVKRKTQLI